MKHLCSKWATLVIPLAWKMRSNTASHEDRAPMPDSRVAPLIRAKAGQAQAPVPAEGTAPLTYANGRGGTSLEADFQARGIGCRLEYRGNFRGGVVTYVDAGLRIDFHHAHGGRRCRFFIELPDEASWENATGTALARRDDIVDFVAETVRREEAGSWRYRIEPTRIRYD